MSKVVPIPFSEPPWLMGIPSAYFKDSHRKWQKTCRAFIDENLVQDAAEWERDGKIPEDVYGKFAKGGFLVPNLYAPLPVEWLKACGIHELPGGLKVEDYDYLHLLIYADEVNIQYTLE
jgi:acyl-CoA dehydrogenase